tara:strand:- start:546 stop:1217 length:672 start_codon:yes stop_codon:yes gene_type:complete
MTTKKTPTTRGRKKSTTSSTTTPKKTAAPKTTKTATKKKSFSVKPLPELPARPFAFEVLDLVSRQRSKAKKIEVLRKYEDISLKAIFIWNFDESIVSLLPSGQVPYPGYDEQNTYSGSLSTKLSYEVRSMHEKGDFSLGVSDQQGHTTIRREWKHFYHFCRGGNNGMNSLRRETMFINILEGLHPLEAEILVLVKDKRLQEVYNITQDVVAEAYSDIQWGGRA